MATGITIDEERERRHGLGFAVAGPMVSI